MVEHDTKPIHSLVLDAGPIITNQPAVSTILSKAEIVYTTPAVISEIKDESARARTTTLLQPFLTLRSPVPASVRLIADFARKTGDLSVLSKNDIDVIALTYELECERNHGDWRLRSKPGQKTLNGKPPDRPDRSDDRPNPKELTKQSPPATTQADGQSYEQHDITKLAGPTLEAAVEDCTDGTKSTRTHCSSAQTHDTASSAEHEESQSASCQTDAQSYSEDSKERLDHGDATESSSDSDGWITPSNLKRRQAQDADTSIVDAQEQPVMQAAILTTDFAMQNVILQMNLNLLSPSLQRIKHLKTFILRCHACFQTTKVMTKQFCPRCGGPTLTRVSCSTDANGQFRLHLKKNMQWNHRGERYSIPKAVHGSANGRNKGGGKDGWGHELILTEDQKEYERATLANRRQKENSLMDEDYLPSILTGDRNKGGGKIKVGAGRNVNARKR